MKVFLIELWMTFVHDKGRTPQMIYKHAAEGCERCQWFIDQAAGTPISGNVGPAAGND
jgi:hypothetical protein